MKKKLLALSLVAMLTVSMSFTAFAASSSTSGSSSSSSSSHSSSSSDDDDDDDSSSSSSSTSSSTTTSTETTVEQASAGGAVAASTVTVAVASSDGTVAATTLDTVISQAEAVVESAAAAAAATSDAQQLVLTVQALMTTAPTAFFSQTVEALANMKGSDVVVNNCGTVKTAATAVDALGNNIASAGVIENVTSGCLVMLMSVDTDGTIEYVEGVVDPVTGAVMGIFQGIPTVITVLVLA
ncbi:MAG: hypothetical protein LUE96_09615 [Lachnospiraceae bacterium]|nr:hypothetical protein [Lachnospiraceae bacterium]